MKRVGLPVDCGIMETPFGMCMRMAHWEPRVATENIYRNMQGQDTGIRVCMYERKAPAYINRAIPQFVPS
jgi:hypothetical protein